LPGDTGREQGAPVHFDDGLFAVDLARLPERARAALDAARGRFEREGVPASDPNAGTATRSIRPARDCPGA